MMRGTFANIRLKNELTAGMEGWWTRSAPGAEPTSFFAASEEYRKAGTPLVIVAGKEYGTGSSRDWAAKGTMLLGVRAVIARASSAFTGRTWSGWGSSRSSSPMAPRGSRSPDRFRAVHDRGAVRVDDRARHADRDGEG